MRQTVGQIIHMACIYQEIQRQGGRAGIESQVGNFPDVEYLGAWLPDGPFGTPCLVRVWYLGGGGISVQIHRYHHGEDIFTGTRRHPHTGVPI